MAKSSPSSLGSMPEPRAIHYKGAIIAKVERTQVGYTTSQGTRGTGRKIKGYSVLMPEEGGYAREKFCDTLREAYAYVDNY